MTIKLAVNKIEDKLRTDRLIRPLTLGEDAMKKLALPTSTFAYKQCLRLKKIATKIVDGSLESQFATLLSRLEMIKQYSGIPLNIADRCSSRRAAVICI